MADLSARYADWKAPSADGQTLLWPDAPELVNQTRDNVTSLTSAHAVRIQNTPLPALRREMRKWLGHNVDDQPIIATGHQTELYHAGVWAKHAMINAAAGALAAKAIFFAVDTDQPKHLSLRWPDWAGPISDDPRLMSAEWSGLLEHPTPRHLKHLRSEYERAEGGWEFQPMLGEFLASMQRLSLENPPLAASITNACHQLDWDLGLRHDAMLASPMLSAPAYLALVHHVCANADAFAGSYNAALRGYRIEAGITNRGRPMPDLKATSAAVEVPFWLDSIDQGERQRAAVVRIDGKWSLVLPDSAFAFDSSLDAMDAAERLGHWLRSTNCRLAPRALTLTMFLRLLVADQFVHGIGGGRYDQVLDKLIASHFKLDPPRFSVATATLFFPAASGRSRQCIPCLKQEGHQLRHRVLGEEKMRLVAAIAAAPRRSFERSRLFSQMHNQLASAAHHPSMTDWETRLRDAERLDQEQRSLFDRELFYALQSRDRLLQITERYRSAFAG